MLDFNKPYLEDADARKARIEDELKRNVRRVVKHLFRNAQMGRDDARIGSLQGDAGQSMSIALTPFDKAGMWIDHATDERGDVFTLIERTLHCASFSDVLSEAEAIIGGVPTPRQIGHEQVQATKPKADKPNILETIEYVYKNKEGRRIATVYRDILDNGKKTFRVHRSSDCTYTAPDPRPLYRLPDVSTSDEVILVEGEKCADALASQGITATTAMFGSNTKLEKIDWTPLAGKRVILWPDNDEAGFKYARTVRPVLEGMGCQVVELVIPDGKPDGWDAADAVEAGEDVRAHLKVVQAPAPKTLPILSVSDLQNMEPPTWLIEGLLIENGLSALYAPAETFKSFMALDIALSIATGQDWRGKASEAGSVVYLIGEGVAGWPARVFTWIERRADGREARFWTIPTSINLTDREDAETLCQTIMSVCEDPALVVVDTLARNFGGGDENSTQDMNAFVSAVDHVRHVTGAHVMLVHHTGKDTEKGGRGSSVLRAALDTEMQCHRPDMDSYFVQFKVTKQKDIEKFDPLMFEMVPVEGVHPGTGEVITSLVPVLRESVPEPEKPERTIDLEILGCLSFGPLTINDLEARTGRQRPWLSKNLSRMEKEGVVSADRSSRATIWACVPQSVPEMFQQNQGEDQ